MTRDQTPKDKPFRAALYIIGEEPVEDESELSAKATKSKAKDKDDPIPALVIPEMLDLSQLASEELVNRFEKSLIAKQRQRSASLYDDDIFLKRRPRTTRQLPGQRFDRLTVVCIDSHTRNGSALWLCHCDCGESVNVRTDHLINGNVKSCGCLKAERGINATPSTKKQINSFFKRIKYDSKIKR